MGVGDRDAQPGPWAAGGGNGQLAAQVGVERAEPVALSGPLGQREQGGQREDEVCEARRGNVRGAAASGRAGSAGGTRVPAAWAVITRAVVAGLVLGRAVAVRFVMASAGVRRCGVVRRAGLGPGSAGDGVELPGEIGRAS